MKNLLLLPFLLLSFFLAGATTWYISPAGNDATGNGTAANPWRTLFKATSTVTTTGDIIHVNAGTYTETLQCVLAPGVSIEGDGRTVTTIRSTITNDFIEMLNCRSAMGTNGNQHITGLKFDGQNSTWALIRIGGRSNFEIYNCDFVDAKIHGVTFASRNTDDNDPGFPATYCTGNKFYDNTMTNCGGWEIPNTGGNGFGNLQFGGQKGMLIYNNTIIQNRAPYNNGWPIKYWQGGYNIGCKIYNNYLQHRLQDFALGDQNWDFAIEMFNVAGLEVYNNTIVNGAIDVNGTTTTGYNTGVGSFWSAGYGYVLHAHDNTFYCQTANSHVQTGITLEFNIDSVIIERNTFDKFNIGVLFTPRTGNTVSNVTIRNNLFTNVTIGDGNEGYFVDCGVYSGVNINFNKLNIYNNTFLASVSSPIVNGIMLPNSTGGGTLKNFNIKNNILKNTSAAPVRVREGTVACDSVDIQYNSIYNCGNNNTPVYTVTPTHYTFANNLNVNPAFGNGYKLVTGNALVDAGTNIGLPFIGTAPDINWTDSTDAAPPVVCNSFDENKTGPGMVLLNSNRTVRKAQYPNATVLSTAAASSGKVCWKMIIDSLNASILYNLFVGIGNTSTDLAGFPGNTVNDFSVRQDGIMFHNGWFNGAYTNSYAQGDTLLLALDLTGTTGSLKYYKRAANAWSLMPQQFTNIPAGVWYPAIGAFGVGFKATVNLAPTDTIPGYSPICTGSFVVVPNTPPTANAGPDQNITLPTSTVSLTGSGTDPDGAVTAYLWTKIAGPIAGTITSPNTAATTVTGLVAGTYQFELRVTDNSGDFGRDTMTVTVNAAANIPPTANAGPDQNITLPTSTVSLSGSGTDPDGSITAYLWTKISGPTAGTITSPNSAATTVTGLTIAGTYRYELRVTDNSGAFGRDTMIVTVNAAANIPPTANAGPDQNITLPTSTVSLSGSGTDPDGSITAYLWTKISGPTAGTITNPNSAATTVTGLTIAGTYRYELRVTDNSGAFGRDTMIVTVNAAANIPPTANAGPDQNITLPTSTVSLSGSGTDPDGSITAYLWTKISGPTAGTITSPNTAATTVTGLVAGTYQFELRVTDNSGAFGRDTMIITVNAAANIPPTANAGPDQNITLPTSTVSLSGSGTDPDGSITAYLWTKISGPTAGTITSPNTAATTVTGLVAGTYQFELRVTDNSGAFGRDTMIVTVNAAANIPPTANAGPDQNITLPTSSVNLAGSGTDPDGSITAYLWTKISGPAAGTITNPNSAATTVTGLTIAGTYRYELRVTDNSGAFGRDTMIVIVNPAPNVPPTANAGPDQNITLPVSSINLAGSGTDPDGSITAYLWTKVSGPVTGGTITNPNSAATSVTGLVAGIYKFELRVTDNSGAFGRDTMTVIVFAPNIPPVANAGLDQSLTLPTNSITLVGSATDVDGYIISYAWTRISGPAAGTITSPSNSTSTVTGLAAGTYQFELRVTDNNGASATDIVQVIVNPENIPPVANAGPDQTITLPDNTVTLNGSGRDVDGTVVAYRWKQISGPADKLLSPNTPLSVLKDLIAGTYVFELTVTDNKGATGADTTQVKVLAETIPSLNNVRVFPNPVSDIVNVNINSVNNTTAKLIEITDMLGKTVYTQKLTEARYITNQKIDMRNLSGGMYIITVHFSSTEKVSTKVLKK
ncbi:MAG: tandem-95 repeat protein [Ferruginibacter sp.]